MKILHTSYITALEFNDPEAWINRISFFTGVLEQLAKNHKVESIEKINYEGELEKNGVLYKFLKFKRKKLHFPFRLNRIIKKRKPDIVFVSGFVLPLPIILLRLHLGKKVKIILINRAEKPYRKVRKFLQKIADKCIDAYLFPSAEFGKLWVENGTISRENKVYEVMHGSSSFQQGDRISAQQSLSIDGKPFFLWVGRLNENKDPLTVVEAFIEFLKLQPEAKLYMVYQTGELLGKIKDLLQASGVKDGSVKLVGRVPHQEMEQWYNAADFIISGSHYEGGGMAVCEAMSCGCIPILTDIIAFRKMTDRGNNGLLYEAGNEKELLAALMKTQQMDMEKERVKVVQRFNSEFSFEAIAKKIDAIILSL